jgi:hypothetical protein
MKTMKILTVVLGLFLTANVNVILAQDAERNDSICGLDVSINNNIMNLSFYSTYNKLSLQHVVVNVFDKETNEQLGGEIYVYYEYLGEPFYMDSLWFSPRYGDGKAYIRNVDEKIFKIEIDNRSLDSDIKDRSLKIELYIEGEGYIPPTRLRSVGRSNMLTFFFDPQTSSLNETNINKDYSFKYFLLSGMESKETPVGVPFVKVTYIDENIISINKYLVTK